MNKITSGEPQSIEQLRARFERLNARKTQAEKDLAVAEANLNAAKRTAKETYGTDDLTELQKMLEQWTAENDRLRREYEQSLDEIEAKLAAIQMEADEPE